MKKLLPNNFNMKGALLFFIFTFPFSLFSFSSKAQSDTKFDFYLNNKLHDYVRTTHNPSLLLPALVKGNIPGIKQLITETGGKFKYAYGNIAAILIPQGALPAFSKSSAVVRMEGQPPHNRVCSDTMRYRNHIVEVQQGLSPLPQAYKGKGVIEGFIDSGIDYQHPDFIDSAGTKSRILYYWDMNQPTGPFTPQPYGYGAAWKQDDIDDSLANNTSSTLEYDHGSNVAGIGAGNGRANGLNTGGAPQADIVYVAYDFTNQTATMLTDAANYIYTVADSIGEPCVINASLGSYDGSHDGLDLQAELLDSMIVAKQPGRVFVAAAGNEGNVPYHLHDSLPSLSDTTFTWFVYDGGNVDIPLFANTADFSNVQFAIGVDNVTTGSYSRRATTGFSTIAPFIGDTLTDTVKNSNNQRLGIITYYGQLSQGVYSMEFYIIPDSTTYYWRLITAGPGKYDGWAFNNMGDIKDTTGLDLSRTTYPELSKYKQPDTLETLCSSYQCSPDVITVGNYYNRRTWVDYNHKLDTNFAATPGMLVTNSGVGPTRNYWLKPDISASGGSTMATLAQNWRSYYISHDPTGIDSLGYHVVDGGTSMACPVIVATAALYLERYPTAKYTDVKNAIIYCADADSFTGAVPNYKWGFGKVDAFKALTNCAPTDVPYIAPPSVNYSLSIYPNPVSNSSVIEYDFSYLKSYCDADIAIYNIDGKKVKSITLDGAKGTVNFSKNELAAGMYFYSLVVDGSGLITEKFEVVK